MFREIVVAGTLLLVASSVACADDTQPSLPADHAERMKVGTALFETSIRPALLTHCVTCHGGEKTRSGFDLTSRKRLLSGGDSGEVVDLKNPDESYLLLLIRHDDEPSMPPAEEKLSDSLIEDFSRWIALGAPYDKPLVDKADGQPTAMQVTETDRRFWSFQPLVPHDPPIAKGVSGDAADWPRTEIDAFVLNKMREHALKPNPPADDHVRIRRLYLDLIGVPPTPRQLAEALKTPHEELVDQLLDSSHYGERWARHWLDAARFAESHGFEQDYDRKFAYHYRDFVIKAFNADMPWNQFVRWQIAGDEIAPEDPLALMATGFLGAGVFPTQLTEKEFESARYDELDDMAATIGTAMLGLTVGCARCHDHKFDPIPTADYYRFVATFATTIRSEIDVDLDPAGFARRLSEWEMQHAEIVRRRDAYRRDAEVSSRYQRWLEEWEPEPDLGEAWTVLDISEATSSEPATTLAQQTDGAILASGKPPRSEIYSVKATTRSQRVRFVRVEALTHDSMNRGGPGRAGNGNFALSDFRLFAKKTDEGDGKLEPVKLVSPRATHQQNEGNLSVASAIDENSSATGWAVDFGGIGKDQAAVFQLATPIETASGLELEFRLTFSNNAQHSLGRFRLSVSAAADPPVTVGSSSSESLTEALAAFEKGQLQEKHHRVLFEIFAAKDSEVRFEWNKRNKAVAASREQKPTRPMAKVQVSSEGFPPTKHHADGRGFPHFYPETYFLRRGDPNQKDGIAQSGFLQVLMRGGKSSDAWQQNPPADWTRTSYRRTGMARWITDAELGAGHLLARVIVNRVWHHHFGRGIVATPNDFGLQGSLPTHPKLLDALAARFIENGWSVKALHREILNSATWLQSNESSAEKSSIDPENKWLWRFPTRRLEAEVVRDAILSASGQLDTSMYGPGTLDPNQRRRSIYFMIKRSRLVPMMQIFDQPEPLSSQGRRPSTTIAPQALLFMNNPQLVKWALAFASEVDRENTSDAIREIYLRALSREPSASELELNERFVEAQIDAYRDAQNARQLALADLCQVVFGLNEFIYLP